MPDVPIEADGQRSYPADMEARLRVLEEIAVGTKAVLAEIRADQRAMRSEMTVGFNSVRAEMTTLDSAGSVTSAWPSAPSSQLRWASHI